MFLPCRVLITGALCLIFRFTLLHAQLSYLVCFSPYSQLSAQSEMTLMSWARPIQHSEPVVLLKQPPDLLGQKLVLSDNIFIGCEF